MGSLQTIPVAAFPGAHSAALYEALQADLFRAAGLDVRLAEVASSSEQLAAWDAGELFAVHTAADHFVWGPRPVPGRLARVEPVGELVVYAVPGAARQQADSLRWGVDAVDGGFALVLRAVVEHVTGRDPSAGALVPLGGTRQRCAALLDGRIDGTALHSPFDMVAAEAGFTRLGGHAEILPDLITNVCVLRADVAGTRAADGYLGALEKARRRLLSSGPDRVRELLTGRGVPAAGAAGIFGAFGLATDPVPTPAGLAAVAGLRARYEPGWQPDQGLLDLLLADVTAS